MHPERFLLFSIDTEPDSSAWKGFLDDNLSFINIGGIVRLLELTGSLGVHPTFLLTYTMAKRTELHALLDPLLRDGTGEIGAHLHPGDTPPFCRRKGKHIDNIVKLPDDTLSAQFNALHEAITREYATPRSFRAGAWTLDHRVIALCAHHGYSADSSTTPGVSWRCIGRPSYLSTLPGAHLLNSNTPLSHLVEIPISIAGSHRGNYATQDSLLWSLRTMPLTSHKRNPFVSIVRALRGPAPVWLCPAFTASRAMIDAARILSRTQDYLHVMCHSSELTVGTSPYHGDKRSLDLFFERLRAIFTFAIENEYKPTTLTEYASKFLERSCRAD